MAVYVIHPKDNAEYVKIGFTLNLKKRLNQMKIAHPCTMVKIVVFGAAGRGFEAYLHILFDEFRKNGEWFAYKGQLKSLVGIIQTKRLHGLWLEWYSLGSLVRPYILNNVFRKGEIDFLEFWLGGTKPQRNAIHQLVKAYMASNEGIKPASVREFERKAGGSALR